ncbi:two-component system response regulator [Maridesulfovibrio sp.]|uniref:response regulator n=1 Tax=Maridesulfovibrio sp. TaxID=2795000 RepID=UPI0029F4690F|nr:two-component system response regulator [Maridesulfovibrio sp.]
MTSHEKQTVLIVDDVPQNLDLLYEVLKDRYRVKAAMNGTKAVEILFSSEPPDIVLLDVMMPEMDGYEVCRRIKADLRSMKIPVIFVTAMGEEQDETYGFELGAVDYITKPINPAIVLARVKTQLALYNQSQHLEELVQERTKVIYATRQDIVRSLGIAARYKDNETGAHIKRMSIFCQIIAKNIGMKDSEGNILLNAAPMHDIGKIGIPDSILTKPGKLDKAEWEIMKTHTTIGGAILGEHDYDLMKVANRVVLNHHERWDGSGYPAGLRGEEIPIEGRISAIADVFDALTSKRPYKEAWPVDKACDYIWNGRGSHFDPRLVDAFKASLDKILIIKEQYSEDD